MKTWMIVALVIFFLYLIRKRSPNDLKGQISSLRNQNVFEWGIVSWWKKISTKQTAKHVEKKYQLAGNLTSLETAEQGRMRAVEETKHTLEKYRMEYDLLRLSHQYATLVAQNKTKLEKEAGENNLTFENYQHLKVKQGEAQIEVLKHQQMTDIDLEKRWKEYQQDIDAADRNELTPHQLVDKLTKFLFTLFDEYRQIELQETDDWLKVKKLEQLDRNIRALGGIINARTQGLLLSENGPEVQRSLPAPNDSGDDRAEVETGEIEVPAKKRRSRPRKKPVAQ